MANADHPTTIKSGWRFWLGVALLMPLALWLMWTEKDKGNA